MICECDVNLRNESQWEDIHIEYISNSRFLVQFHDLIIVWLKLSNCLCLAMLDSINNILQLTAEFPSV